MWRWFSSLVLEYIWVGYFYLFIIFLFSFLPVDFVRLFIVVIIFILAL